MLDLDSVFSRKKSQKKVAEYLLRRGINVSTDRRFFMEDLEISSAAIARALGLDRRVVTATAEVIASNPGLKEIYSKLNSALLLKEVAPEMGFGAIEVISRNPASTGIIAKAAKIIADAGISIRQITTDDPLFRNIGMAIVTERPIPRELIDRMLEIDDVEKVIVIN